MRKNPVDYVMDHAGRYRKSALPAKTAAKPAAKKAAKKKTTRRRKKKGD